MVVGEVVIYCGVQRRGERRVHFRSFAVCVIAMMLSGSGWRRCEASREDRRHTPIRANDFTRRSCLQLSTLVPTFYYIPTYACILYIYVQNPLAAAVSLLHRLYFVKGMLALAICAKCSVHTTIEKLVRTNFCFFFSYKCEFLRVLLLAKLLCPQPRFLTETRPFKLCTCVDASFKKHAQKF